MNRNRLFSLPFVLSLLAHGVVAALLLFTTSTRPPKPARLNQVELIDATALLERVQKNPGLLAQGQIVEQDQKALNDEVPTDSKYLSRHNQKVVQQTQSQNHGKFRNTNEASGPVSETKMAKKTMNESKDKSAREERPSRKAETLKDDKKFYASDDGPVVHSKPTLKDLIPKFRPGPPPTEGANVAQGGGEGPSASDDHLADVKHGMQTLLSTREFVYYTYYNRIKDKLRQYWEPKIKEKMERIVRQGRTVASSDNRITRIVIVLDDHGTLVRVQIVGASGVSDLDDAAVEAFRAAAPFPNPPRGIVEGDGTIKIRWDFILEA